MIEIPTDIRSRMVEQAFAELPNEACGLLAGRNGSGDPAVERFYPMTNADRSPMNYRLDPTEQLRIFDEIEESGWDLVGIFHSHTHTRAYPSPTDKRQAFYPDAHYVLVSLSDRNNPDLKAFTIRDGEIEEQEVKVV